MVVGGIRRFFPLSCWLLMTLAVLPLWAGPPVAETDPLTPEEQRTKFKLPPGFDIQLVAAEPDIQKPMNLAFDARGRLWVTHSIEYPWAADPEKARDGVTILEDFGPDGRARKVTKFAENLNIPIGVLPLPSGREAIVWSIPNIWKLTDEDGDGHADKREILYGPFDFVDTHGNQNAFRLGNDGWIYACHGFRNSSKIKLRGEGPVVLEMNSGNTYRFKPDGSAIEQLSWGQVNPFGMCIDARGDLYTADCHSKPVTMILRGGYYDSFGKPDDGLGFAPVTTSNDHGSTGIAGIVAYSAPQFPAEFSGSMFVGNVVTNIVHRDRLEWRGSSPWVSSVEDFMTCSDWWFHPVDLQLGPDGALYVSDFYNSIIGHYEVDLKHPRRDRHRGRLWRIVYTGPEGNLPVPEVPNLHALNRDQLIARLSDSNTTVRNLAGQELQTRGTADSDAAVKAVLETSAAAGSDARALARVQGLWLLFRSGKLTLEHMTGLAQDPAAIVRTHLMRALGETDDWTPQHVQLAHAGLQDQDPFVRRATVESIARHPDPHHLQPLVKLWQSTPEADAQLVHACRIAIRNQLRPSSAVDQIASITLTREELASVVDIAMAVPSEAAAWFTFDYIRQYDAAQPVVERCLRHVARYVGPQRLDEVARFVQDKFATDLSQQTSLFQSLFAGLTQRGARLNPQSELGRWAAQLSARLLDPATQHAAAWENRTVTGVGGASIASPWGVRNRASADGKNDALFFDSISNGEHLTGVLTSAPFTIPAKLSFFLCGHNGLPGTDPPPVNHIRLRLVSSGQTIASQTPPRNDVAQQYVWDLTAWAGQKGILEVIDADTGSAYAWLAVGRIEPAVVANPVENFAFVDTSLVTAVQVASQLKLAELTDPVIELIRNAAADAQVRIAAAQAGLTLNKEAAVAALIQVVQNSSDPSAVRAIAAQLLGSVNSPTSRQSLGVALGQASGPLQQPMALALVSSPEGGELLLTLISQGKASARLLQDKPILDRMATLAIQDRDQRIEQLTQGLPAADDRLKEVASRLLSSFSSGNASAEAGLQVFKKTCAACHRINSEGGKVGPQLDGVGIRGLERLLEDVLDPNRNVDAAFRAIVVAKTDGVVITGLKLREEGGAMIVGDNQGKELRIPLEEIEESRLSNLSPMPSNFSEQLNENDFRNLMAFLLSQRQAPVKE